MNKREKGLDEPRGAFPGRTLAGKQAPLHHYVCLPTELYLSRLFYLPLQHPQPYIAHPEEQTLNKQTAQTHHGCSGWGHLSGETKSLSPISADKTAWALGVSPSAGDTQPGKAKQETLNQVFSAEPGPGVEGRGLLSQRLLLLNEPKQSQCQGS